VPRATTPFPRYLAPRLREALGDTPAVLIHGPRQSGKTTLARAVGEALGYRYVSFDDDAIRTAAKGDPVGFMNGLPAKTILVLQKLLKGELATRRRKNVVQARSFADMLEQTIRRYQNRAIEAAQVIEELIALAKEMREAHARGESLRLSEDELAFYDALETNDSAVKVLGDETLRTIAQELVRTVRANVTIDWTLRENVRAQPRVLVKRILRRYGYPPDKQEKATETVLEQAALLSAEWAVG
jgi:type I restriction enzyme R subunit